MYLLLNSNKLNTNNIIIKYNKIKNEYSLLYSILYGKMNGIFIQILYTYSKQINNYNYIFISNRNIIKLFKKIQTNIQKTIPSFILLREKNYQYFIITKSQIPDKSNNIINISIKKIIWLHQNYIPIISII